MKLIILKMTEEKPLTSGKLWLCWVVMRQEIQKSLNMTAQKWEWCELNYLSVTYLQEFINFNLSILVEVHLVKDFMERVFVNVDVDALRRGKTRPGIRIKYNEDELWRERKSENSLPELAAHRRWWWILCSLCQTCGSAFCTCQTGEQEFSHCFICVMFNLCSAT